MSISLLANRDARFGKILNSIAPVEPTGKATRAYSEGDYLIRYRPYYDVDDSCETYLFKVIAPIEIGDFLLTADEDTTANIVPSKIVPALKTETFLGMDKDGETLRGASLTVTKYGKLVFAAMVVDTSEFRFLSMDPTSDRIDPIFTITEGYRPSSVVGYYGVAAAMWDVSTHQFLITPADGRYNNPGAIKYQYSVTSHGITDCGDVRANFTYVTEE